MYGRAEALQACENMHEKKLTLLHARNGHKKAENKLSSQVGAERLRIPYTSVLSVDTRGLGLLQVISPTYP